MSKPSALQSIGLKRAGRLTTKQRDALGLGHQWHWRVSNLHKGRVHFRADADWRYKDSEIHKSYTLAEAASLLGFAPPLNFTLEEPQHAK